MISLLCRDKVRFSQCAHLLKEHDQEFLQLVFRYSFANLVLEELTLRGASATFKNFFVRVMDDLRRQCVAESLAYQPFDDRFTQFISQLGSLNDELIWLKGIVTSRTLFVKSTMRLSTDFDFFALPAKGQQLVESARSMGYRRNWYDPAFCNQLEVGPTVSFEQSFIAPAPYMVPSAVVGLEQHRYPIIDVKNPLHRGCVW